MATRCTKSANAKDARNNRAALGRISCATDACGWDDGQKPSCFARARSNHSEQGEAELRTEWAWMNTASLESGTTSQWARVCKLHEHKHEGILDTSGGGQL